VFGFYQVDQQERAVVLRLGVYHDTRGAGLQWNPPLIDIVEIINVTKVRSVRHQATMLTEDENIVDVTVSVQYTVNDPANFLLKVRDPETSLKHALESALRHVVGGSKMDLVITEGREQLAVEVRSRLQGYLNVYSTGIFVSQVNIDDSQPPTQVQEAFNDVTRAKEDKEKFKNEAEAYANAIIPEARGQAQRQLEEAQGYRDQVVASAQGEAHRFVKLLGEYQKAPEVTRQRLYIDTVQQVYADSTKVMVDVEGGNNMMYLPLDKIVGQGSGSSRVSSGGIPTTQAVSLDEQDLEDITRRVVERLRREMQTTRRREGR
jgi:membrane protease subunit HflK